MSMRILAALLLTALVPAARADGPILAESTEPLIPGAKMPLKLWEIERIAPDLYSFRYTFYRNVFMVTPEGVIATDPLTPEAAATLQAQLPKVTDQPVRYVVYSHSHFDHASGGKVFKDAGATFVAHERCAANWREHTTPDIVMPDVTWKDHHVIELGGRSLELFYYGPAHDNCLAALLFRPANMLFLVDMGNLPTGWTMFYNPTVSEDRVWNMVRWHRSVEALIEREQIATVIGAHINTGRDAQGRLGFIRATTGPAHTVTERRMFWEGGITAAREAIAAGTPPAAVPDLLVERKVLADKVVGWEPEKMRIFFRRMVTYVLTGE
jgi:glyoxylase-like metal-dependent hydrolase (beta-lactamase superfamily II)